MATSRSLLIVSAVALVSQSLAASAATLFSDNFNSDSSGSWAVNVAPSSASAAQSATWAFDYSAFGIPPAPGSSDTLGLRLRANIPGGAASPVTTRPAGTLSGLSVSPLNQDFGSRYQATFYAWSNFNGAPNAAGLADNGNSEGGTNNVLFAVGTSGNVPIAVGNTTLVSGASMDGIGFATTGDGGISNDYRIYPKSGTILPAGSPQYSAATLANTDSFYQAKFPAVSAPSIQQSLSTAEFGSDLANTQAGQTQPGAFGFAWHKVMITKDGNLVTWDIDDNRIATYDITNLGALGGNDIALGVSDVNSSTTRHPALLFTVFDNLVVTNAPEPASASLLVIGAAAMIRRRQR